MAMERVLSAGSEGRKMSDNQPASGNTRSSTYWRLHTSFLESRLECDALLDEQDGELIYTVAEI
jgi:hypothetical protein